MNASVSEPLLDVRDLAVTGGPHRLLEGLSFQLASGDRLAITGPSGCGKSTLLRALAGLDDPAAGEIHFNGRGREAWGWPQFRRQVVLVDQRPVLLNETVGANLCRPFAYRTSDNNPFPEERARQLLDEFKVGASRFDQDARTLSVGQQQRVCLIRALLLSPAVLLMDEPTSALDEEAIQEVEQRILTECSERKMAALIVTHDGGQARRWCERHIDLKPFLSSPSRARAGGEA